MPYEYGWEPYDWYNLYGADPYGLSPYNDYDLNEPYTDVADVSSYSPYNSSQFDSYGKYDAPVGGLNTYVPYGAEPSSTPPYGLNPYTVPKGGPGPEVVSPATYGPPFYGYGPTYPGPGYGPPVGPEPYGPPPGPGGAGGFGGGSGLWIAALVLLLILGGCYYLYNRGFFG
ncbi:MAG TPA: hypothetical protein VFT51_06580 [Bacillales bacterium]|nr:hypothetical protein [Bacillales bacterium]